jgi:outer membrane receptor protein involved in Fe transport
VSYSSNRSVGFLARWRQDFPSALRARLIAGLDFDHSPGQRQEDRLNVTVSGTGASRVFSAYTTGPRVYDYEVTFQSISPYLHAEASPLPPLRVTAGLRWDHLSYDQSNNLPGTFSQGAPTAFYGQVQNGEVSFSRTSPKIAATWSFNPEVHAYTSYNTGFRIPSESQLFRPSVSTNANDATNRARLSLELKPIKAEQVELGVRGDFRTFNFDAVLYDLQKKDDLVNQRDLATNVTTSVNAGETRHRGIEVGAGWRIDRAWRMDAAFSYAKHTYEDWVTSAGNFSGKEIESAPRELGNLRLTWTPIGALFTQVEWTRVGSYWLEASNSPSFPKYPGHDLFNLRARYAVTPTVALVGRVINLTDERYADSAGISSNTPVYSPGLPRTYYAGIEATW